MKRTWFKQLVDSPLSPSSSSARDFHPWLIAQVLLHRTNTNPLNARYKYFSCSPKNKSNSLYYPLSNRSARRISYEDFSEDGRVSRNSYEEVRCVAHQTLTVEGSRLVQKYCFQLIIDFCRDALGWRIRAQKIFSLLTNVCYFNFSDP